MRLLSIVTAALVCAALVIVVLQRDALMAFAAALTSSEEAAPTTPEAPAGSVPVSIAETARAEDDAAVLVTVLRSEARQVPDSVMVRGQTDASREVTVAAETSGTVVSEPIRKGATIETGDVLCELDPGSRGASLAEAEAALAEARSRVPEAEARVPQARAVVAEAEARLEEARLNQNAASRLSEGGYASDTQVANAAASLRSAEAGVEAARTGLQTVQAGIEAATAGVQSAEAALERARLEIENLSVEAPFSGFLETDTAELGSLLQAGGVCATVVQLDPVKLVGFLAESQVDRVETGAAAGARLASGGEAQGQVTYVSRTADDLTRTFRVEVTVPNPDLAIRDGQTAEILIETPARTAHLLPSSALTLDDDGRLGVRAVEDGVTAFRPVTLVRDTTEGVIVAGLPEILDVIVVGQDYVTEGVPVRISRAEGMTPEALAAAPAAAPGTVDPVETVEPAR